ncbi:hypothetical protein O988_06924 [Pseudogymnoascus sp. VKM F-3808]|nr:hypothetical protein O988_06924 [Pseudogymnoascus sp. VKM F-3808]
MDAAACIASFVGLAGQILQVSQYLRNFLVSARDAPIAVQTVTTELEHIWALLNNLKLLTTCVDTKEWLSDDVKSSVEYCAEVLGKLKTLIEKENKKFNESANDSTIISRRLRKQLSFAFKKQEFENLVARIERAKSLLLAVEMQIVITQQNSQMNPLREAVQVLTSLHARQTASITTLLSIQEGIDKTYEMGIETQQAIKELRKFVIRKNTQMCLTITDSMDKPARALRSGHNPLVNQSGQDSIDQKGDQTTIFGPTTCVLGHDQANGRTNVALTKNALRGRSTRIYKLWFGTIIVSSSEHMVSEVPPVLDKHVAISRTTTGISLSGWFIGSRVITVLIDRQYSTLNQGPLSLHLRFHNVVPFDSPIIQACATGDYPKYCRIIQDGSGSPFDRALIRTTDANPQGLLYWAFASLRRTSISNEVNELSMCLIRHLVNAGLDPAEIGIARVVEFDARDPTAIQHTKTDLLRLILEKSREDPFQSHSTHPEDDESYNTVARIFQWRQGESPIWSLLTLQEHWHFDWEKHRLDPLKEKTYWCTFISIRNDPEGTGIRQYFNQSHCCLDDDCYIREPLLDRSARRKWRSGSHQTALRNRFVAVLKNGFNPWNEDWQTHCIMDLAQSVNQLDTWLQALLLAGWEKCEIQELVLIQTLGATQSLFQGLKYYTSKETAVSICFNRFKELCKNRAVPDLSQIIWDAELELLQCNWTIVDILELQNQVDAGGAEVLFEALYSLLEDANFWEVNKFHTWKTFFPPLTAATITTQVITRLSHGLSILSSIV